MSASANVTFQINLAPTDYVGVREILPHQLRQWAGQVDEVLLVVDLHRSQGLLAEAKIEQLPGLRRLIDECMASYSNVRSVDVDYSPASAQAVADQFYGGSAVPLKDWRAAPIYPYFYGIHAASNPYVFHTDSDIMYGGGSQAWAAEAVELLQSRPDVLVCSPLPGPPTADGVLRSQSLVAEQLGSPAYRADSVSTRLFMIDLERFSERVGSLRAVAPSPRQTLMARVDGNPPFETAELMISHGMQAAGLIRIDFLGREPGMWSLHPPYRSKLFYERLPALIDQVESGRVPELQRGDHDMNDSMIDWSTARTPRWQRWSKHAEMLLRSVHGAGRG
jgi:hypothetical protein